MCIYLFVCISCSSDGTVLCCKRNLYTSPEHSKHLRAIGFSTCNLHLKCYYILWGTYIVESGRWGPQVHPEPQSSPQFEWHENLPGFQLWRACSHRHLPISAIVHIAIRANFTLYCNVGCLYCISLLILKCFTQFGLGFLTLYLVIRVLRFILIFLGCEVLSSCFTCFTS